MSAELKQLFAAYSVRNVKTFIGMEGRGFNATLCRDGKSVALVIDDAHGGSFQFRWISSGEEKALQSLCERMPPGEFEGISIAFDMDQLASRLVDDYENDKRLRRIAKKKTLFRLKGDSPDEWRTINVVGQRATHYLAMKYGDQLESVYGQGVGA